jgi:uncharacterized protein (UPF0147 family)
MTTKRKPAKKAKVAKKTKAAVRRTPRAAMSVATSSKKPTQQRVAALAEVPLAVCENDENLQSLLKILRDRAEPIKVRLAALQSLQAASFSVIAFESCRGDYLAALRELADDPDLELRQRVLGILARENDSYVQQRLLDGLQDPTKALVPPEKALQLLSYDVHAEAYPIAREIVNKPPNPEAKREALRLLSADASSAPVFEKLMLDKKEPREIRQISAAALQAVKPKRFQERARDVILDNTEYDDIQATALTALTQFGDETAVAKDETLLKRVDRLGKGKSAKVKKTAKRFLSRYK